MNKLTPYIAKLQPWIPQWNWKIFLAGVFALPTTRLVLRLLSSSKIATIKTDFHIVHKRPVSGWSSVLSDNDNTYLTLKDSSKFLSQLRELKPNQDIKIYLDTPGGELAAAEIIAHALILHKGKIQVYVADKAYSAGTLLALCADEIYLRPGACLGPVDPQMSALFFCVSAASIDNCVKNSTSWVGDMLRLLAPDAVAAVARVDHVLDKICELRGYDPNKVKNVFLRGGLNHDQPIFYEPLRSLGLNVKEY